MRSCSLRNSPNKVHICLCVGGDGCFLIVPYPHKILFPSSVDDDHSVGSRDCLAHEHQQLTHIRINWRRYVTSMWATRNSTDNTRGQFLLTSHAQIRLSETIRYPSHKQCSSVKILSYVFGIMVASNAIN